MVGASNTKLLTGMLALEELGPDSKVRTRVTHPSRDHVVLVGAGDQLLNSAELRRLARRAANALRQSGVSHVRVGYDGSFYRWHGAASGWRSADVNAYGPGPVWSLVRDDGRYSNAPRDAGQYFARRLADTGIRVRFIGQSSSGASPDLVVSPGHTVAQILKASLVPSDSDKAEALGRLTAIHHGQPGTWVGGWAAQREILEDLDAPLNGVRLNDSSGLSRRNRVTTNLLVHVLRAAVSAEHPRMNALLRRRLLATAGHSGTIASGVGRFNESSNRCAVGRIHAKTGTLSGGVLALSGYAAAVDGRWKLFSIIVNHRPNVPLETSRRAIDDIAAKIVGCS